ncbi:MAG TPA: sialidase family protein [Pyrinomonadaceae bacterium]
MFIKRYAIAACLASLTFLAGCAQKAEQPAGTNNAPGASEIKPVRVSAENTDGAEPAVAAAPDGTVYVAWVVHQENKDADVMLAHLDAEGKVKGEPTRVNPNAGEATSWRGDQPTVKVAPDGTIYVGWTARITSQKHANDLFLSASRDGGKTFEPPVKVNDDRKAVGHGMHSLAVGADNRVYVAWLDERDVVKPHPAKQTGAAQKMENMEANRDVFFAASSDGGRTFSPNQRLAKDACPCCKTAVEADARGRVFVSWRQVLPGEYRHIALAASEDGGRNFRAPVIVSDDRWMIAACPVSGPALAIGDDNALRVVWYTEGDKGGAPGLFWAQSTDDGKTFSESRPLAKGEARGTPLLLAGGKSGATVIWESNEGGPSRVMSAKLADGQSAASAAGSGELPSAALSGDQLFVCYIAKINDQRSVWVMRAKATA